MFQIKKQTYVRVIPVSKTLKHETAPMFFYAGYKLTSDRDGFLYYVADNATCSYMKTSGKHIILWYMLVRIPGPS